jgi:hypothetical protein
MNCATACARALAGAALPSRLMLLAIALPYTHLAVLGLLTVFVSVWWFTMRKMF